MDNISPRFRILLVEDDHANRFMLEFILKEYGYDYDVATNGAETINLATSTTYDIILMDVTMPILDGYEATEIIRKHEKQKYKSRTPIIGLTAHAFIGDMEKCHTAGMDDYISKPINIDQFETKLKSWVQINMLSKTG